MQDAGGAASTDPAIVMGDGGTGAASSNSGIAEPGVPWASGGTSSMKGGYDDPFANGTGTACSIYPSQTLGPCYARGPEVREDISDQMVGLPMRLSFLVVHEGCKPVANASVDIWHCGYDGIYSAYGQGSICNPDGGDVRGDMYCRGVGFTDERGRVDFSSIFPGWYSGRAIHIHFTVRLNDREEATSQLYFEDDLISEIHTQGEYAARGANGLPNARDRIFGSGGASPDEVIMSTAKRPDGVLHAWKTLAIR